MRRFIVSIVVLLTSLATLAQTSLCNSSLNTDLSPECITERGLDSKVTLYKQKLLEAMWKLDASYKIELRVTNSQAIGVLATSGSDVYTDRVLNAEMRNESFVTNVTSYFLENQPEILFEASSLHEVCHVMNDDLEGYHRNGENIEMAEERCVMEHVGEARYEEYLHAYATYQHWDSSKYEKKLQKVKDVVLVPAPSEVDEADTLAATWFRSHADGNEHILVYDGEINDITSYSTRDRSFFDPTKLSLVIKAGKPLIFFHNHPPDGIPAMFPSYSDFGAVGRETFLVYVENPNLTIEFRVMELTDEITSMSYGLKAVVIDEIKKNALAYHETQSRLASLVDWHGTTAPREKIAEIDLRQNLLDYHIAQDSFGEYLQHACPVDLNRKDADVCKTHPQYFLWPSDKFFLHYRGTIVKK